MSEYQPTKYVSVADTAKLIRKVLKEQFPGQKFSVRSNSYSGGASIRVNWVDGPSRKAVEAAVSYYKGATFDGMIDLKEYVSREEDGQRVHYGSDYIFCDRDASSEALAAAQALAERAIPGFDPQGSYWDGASFEFGFWQGGHGQALLRWIAEKTPEQAERAGA